MKCIFIVISWHILLESIYFCVKLKPRQLKASNILYKSKQEKLGIFYFSKWI